MTKKATAAKADIDLSYGNTQKDADQFAKANKPAAPVAANAEPWNREWSVARRLLKVRGDLRGTKLWAEFEIKRKFEAFSIHTMANGIEPVLNGCGLISSFRVTKWDKVENKTVIEGMVTYESVDDGEIKEYPGVGEAVDNGDKGMHKATSDARKAAFISSLNLGVGFDKEEEDPKVNGNGKPMGGSPAQAGAALGNAFAPQQQERKVEPVVNGEGKPIDYSTQSYTLQQVGLQGRAVLGRDIPQACFTIISNSPTVSSLKAWEDLNLDMLLALSTQLPKQAEALKSIYDARVKQLTEKGAL